MSIDDFRAEAQALLAHLLYDAATSATEREVLLQNYTDEVVRLHGRYAHQLLNDVIADAHTRLDARLSPDPLRQTIASVQMTVQDLWKTLTQPFSSPPEQALPERRPPPTDQIDRRP